MKPTNAEIAFGIRSELRNIIKMRRDLDSPIQQFEPITNDDGNTRYYVSFDIHPHKRFVGPKFAHLKEWIVRDERIEAKVLEMAKTVWHLKDRLHQFAKSKGYAAEIDDYAKAHQQLLICADLANLKKHGRNENRSKINPRLGLIRFDTSNNGPAEVYYDGAMKDKELEAVSKS